MLYRSGLRSSQHCYLRSANQRRYLFEYAISHPDQTLLALTGMATAVGGLYRLWVLELRLREQESTLKSQETAMSVRIRQFEEVERHLRDAADEVRRRYDIIRDEKMRMEASIIDRGKAGEVVLGNLLDECKLQGVIKSFALQREISPGKIPDAFVEMIDGIFIVIDSKAPTPPYDVVDDASRREYVNKLKGHIRDLGDKRYTSLMSDDKQCITVTLMMLPGEGYLQAAYEDGRDVYELNKFARDRNVLLLGPNGLRTLLQVGKIWFEEKVANDRLADSRVHENIVTTLQPLWVLSILPFMRSTGNLLESAVTSWNSKVDSVVAFDKALRSKDILDLGKTRKTELPKKITIPKCIDDTLSDRK